MENPSQGAEATTADKVYKGGAYVASSALIVNAILELVTSFVNLTDQQEKALLTIGIILVNVLLIYIKQKNPELEVSKKGQETATVETSAE